MVDDGLPREFPLPSFLNAADWLRIMAALRLSRREAQILCGFFAEANDHAIAAALGMKLPTVREHIERLYRKLHTHSRSGAIIRIFATYAAVLSPDDSARDDLPRTGDVLDLPLA